MIEKNTVCMFWGDDSCTMRNAVIGFYQDAKNGRHLRSSSMSSVECTNWEHAMPYDE